MKLKSLIAAALLVTSMSTFAVDITVSPLYTVMGLVQSAVGSVAAPFVSTSATLEANKEQLKAVAADASDYLAGDKATDTLAASFAAIRAESEELNAMSNDQLAGLIIAAIQ